MTAGTLLYLYGVVPSDAAAPPADLQGVEGGRVRLLAAGTLTAVVTEVEATTYQEEALDARLGDLEWVGARGVAHERVLTWFVDRGPVVPFAPFSLHADADALRARLAEREQSLSAALERVRGKREWGVRLWRDEARFAEWVGRESGALRDLAAQLREASPGRHFLLAKKEEALRAEETRRLSSSLARSVYASLAEVSVASRALPIPTSGGRGAARSLILHSAFLVRDDGYEQFELRLRELAGRHDESGLDWEFTGPWPPYHFAGGAADGGGESGS